MSTQINKPDEHETEVEAPKEVTQEEIRESLVEKFGINPDEQSDLLEKLVESELENREKLSSAIKQKINYRTKYQEVTKNSGKPEEGNAHKTETTIDAETLRQQIREEFEQRDLEQLGLPDEIEEEVKKIAKLNNTSVRDAVNDPYVQFRLEQIEHKERIDNATPRRTYQGGNARNDAPKAPNPDDFNLATEEGREKWAEAKAKFHKSRQA